MLLLHHTRNWCRVLASNENLLLFRQTCRPTTPTRRKGQERWVFTTYFTPSLRRVTPGKLVAWWQAGELHPE
jgi:hypothetical protein